MCRSRRELSHEYLIAKIGLDAAENEPSEILKFGLSSDNRQGLVRGGGGRERASSQESLRKCIVRFFSGHF